MEDFIEDDGESYDFYEMDKSPVDGNQSSGFECNICLDLVQDPVVTLCGHLYCWACIYKWLDSPNVSIENSQQEHQCPVCKAEISHTALIPLYGRGQSARNTKSKTRHLGIVIPRRPLGPTFGIDSPILGSTTPSPILHQQPYSPSYLPHSQYDPTPSMVSLSSTTATSIVDPIVGIFGEMVFAMVSGNSEANLYPYPNSYHLENMSPRVRRHMMQVNRSLSRICFFLLCCSILCLLLF